MKREKEKEEERWVLKTYIVQLQRRVSSQVPHVNLRRSRPSCSICDSSDGNDGVVVGDADVGDKVDEGEFGGDVVLVDGCGV